MSTSIETKRLQEALELQITAIRAYASRLSVQDIEELEAEFAELERAVSEFRGIIDSVPHAHRQPAPSPSPPASPATKRPERLAKGAETAAGTQRRDQ